MALRALVSPIIVLVVTSPGSLRAGGETGPVSERLAEILAAAGKKLGVEFRAMEGSTDAFAGRVTRGLETCEGIDLEVHLRDGSVAEVVACPRPRGGPLDTARATDRPVLLERLGAPSERMAPLAWVKAPEGALRASCAVRLGDASAAEEIERALLAAPALDREAAKLLSCFPPRLSEDEIQARLRDAAGSDARRGEILSGIAAYLPELEPSRTPGRSKFEKVAMNGRGAGLDAFRFRVPSEPPEQRLVWAFAYPPGTAKGWYIAPVAGDAPKLVKFHSGKKYAGTGIPSEHATLLQRAETPLRGGAEYIIWFQFKVDRPVDIYAALGCFPYSKSDRDALPVLEAALGLEAPR